ncbi:MAG: hypothetical protein LAO07_12795, partial [Acidobacteriia bacterium]|nr:hypothetical protein [Terriglobia bacterium]
QNLEHPVEHFLLLGEHGAQFVDLRLLLRHLLAELGQFILRPGETRVKENADESEKKKVPWWVGCNVQQKDLWCPDAFSSPGQSDPAVTRAY